ncbi:hypothetical protein HQ531_09010 [bacterium]|nr:hypothetical protein [bacterium]
MIKRYLVFVLTIILSLFTFSCSNPDDDTTPPDSPSNFMADTDLSYDGEVLLEWNANSEDDLDGYVLYRNTSGENAAFDSLTMLNKESTSYLDYGLEYETTYYYKLRAFDEEGNRSGFSPVVSRTPINWNSPDPVTGLIIHAHNLSDVVDVKLRWSPNGETDFSHYIVYKFGSGSSTTAIDTTDLTSSTDNDVISGTTYSYIVRAYDKGGYESNPSAIVSDTPLTEPELLGPINDAHVSLTPSFQWNEVENATSYRIQVKKDVFDLDLWNEVFEAGSASYMETYAGSALDPSTSYIWYISAYSGDPEDVNVRSEVATFETMSQ